MTSAAPEQAATQHDEQHRLTAVQGLAALSLDALSSVASGPEAILVVLVAAGAAGLRYSLPVTGAIILLLAALVVSYRQVIEAFPNGGGAYAVARAHLGTRASLVAAASLAAALLVASQGDTQALIPLFAVGVFVGFTLSQVGMVRHWSAERSPGWTTRAVINGLGAVLTAATTVIELVSKFLQGAWLIVLVIPGLVLLFSRVHRRYVMIGALLELGQTPKPPSKKKSLVVVPVASMSRLTAEGISAALSLGDDVVAVTVCFADPEDMAADVSFRGRREEWHPNVPLITLRSARRSIAPPIVRYLSEIEAQDHYHRLVVLIPEVQPPRFWEYLLFNQRGAILDRAIRRGTANVVLCRLRYRLEQFTPRAGGSGMPSLQDGRAGGGGRADGRDGGQERVLGGGGEDPVGHAEQPPER